MSDKETFNHCEDNLNMVKQEQGEPVGVTYKEVADAMNSLMMGDSTQLQLAEKLGNKKLYTTPPQPSTIVRTWISLTAEEISSIEHKVYSQTIQKGKPMKAFIEQFAKAIDLALKGKNHHA
jgi:hypothetical protein